MTNKYLRLKIIARQNQKLKEIERQKKAKKQIKVLTKELYNAIINP